MTNRRRATEPEATAIELVQIQARLDAIHHWLVDHDARLHQLIDQVETNAETLEKIAERIGMVVVVRRPAEKVEEEDDDDS